MFRLVPFCELHVFCACQAVVYIEDGAADNDGAIGPGIDVMVPANGMGLMDQPESWG